LRGIGKGQGAWSIGRGGRSWLIAVRRNSGGYEIGTMHCMLEQPQRGDSMVAMVLQNVIKTPAGVTP